MLPQHALHEATQVGTDVLAQRPVDGDVAPHVLDQLAGDATQCLVAEHLHCAVVDAERVVERRARAWRSLVGPQGAMDADQAKKLTGLE